MRSAPFPNPSRGGNHLCGCSRPWERATHDFEASLRDGDQNAELQQSSSSSKPLAQPGTGNATPLSCSPPFIPLSILPPHQASSGGAGLQEAEEGEEASQAPFPTAMCHSLFQHPARPAHGLCWVRGARQQHLNRGSDFKGSPDEDVGGRHSKTDTVIAVCAFSSPRRVAKCAASSLVSRALIGFNEEAIT